MYRKYKFSKKKKKQKYIFFFDLNEVLLDRYPAKIAKYLAETLPFNIGFVFLYSEKYVNAKSKPKRLPKDSTIIYCKNFTVNKMNSIIDKYPPIAFITIGLRIPDIFLLGYFNKINVRTYMVQHGIFIDHLSRIPLYKLIKDKSSKFIQYLGYAFQISKFSEKSFFQLVKDLYKFYFSGTKNFSDCISLNNSNLISQKAFIFDATWIPYYSEKYNYKSENCIVFGNPDHELISNFELEKTEKSICYICQSLVEDGRYLKADYINFLTEMKSNLKDFKIYVKLHPRSKLELYNHIFDENFIRTTEFKNCKIYMGHYSSLLELGHKLQRSVILWDLEKHEIPNNFLKYATLVSCNWHEVKTYIEKIFNNPSKVESAQLEEKKIGISPFQRISNYLLEDLSYSRDDE